MNNDASLYHHLINNEFNIWHEKYIANKNITWRYALLKELLDNIERISMNNEFLEHIILNTLIKVELTQYEPSFSNDLNNQARFTSLEIIENYPFNQFTDVNKAMYIANVMMKSLFSDNEDNAIISLRITNILCTIFDNLIDNLVPQVIAFIESIYENYQSIVRLRYFPTKMEQDKIHKATHSFNVMNECFNILFRFWNKFLPIIESFSNKLFPQCLDYVKIISSQINDNVDSLDYIDFKKSQVHTFHLLLLILDFIPNSKEYTEDILLCVVTQLKNFSNDEDYLRKEILILSREFIRYFKDDLTDNMIVYFTNERNLIGYSPVYASYDIKVLAFKIMCDILNYKKMNMNVNQLETMIYFFCRSIQDKTFPIKVHIHSIQVIIDCIKYIHEDSSRESFNSVILIRIIQTFNQRYNSLHKTINKMSKMLNQLYLNKNLINEYNLYQLCNIFNVTEVIERRMQLEDVYNMSIIYTINDILIDIRRLVKTLSSAVREVVTRFCINNGDTNFRFDGINMLCERLSTTKLISYGLKCLRVFTKRMNQLLIENGLMREEDLRNECEGIVENTVFFLDISHMSIIYEVLFKLKETLYNLTIKYQYPYTIIPRKIIEKMKYHFIEELYLTFYTNRLRSNEKLCEDKLLLCLIKDLFNKNCLRLTNNIVPYILELSRLSLKKAFAFNSSKYLTLINSIFKFLVTSSFDLKIIEELILTIIEITLSTISPVYSDLRIALFKTSLTIPIKVLLNLTSKQLLFKLIANALEVDDIYIKQLSLSLLEELIDLMPFKDFEKNFKLYKTEILSFIWSQTCYPPTQMTPQSLRIIGKLSGLGMETKSPNNFSINKPDQHDIKITLRYQNQSPFQFNMRELYIAAIRFIKSASIGETKFTKKMLNTSFNMIKSCVSSLLPLVSSSPENSNRKIEYRYLTFRKLIQSVILSMSIKEIKKEAVKFFESLCLHFILINENNLESDPYPGTLEFVGALVKSISILEKRRIESLKPLEIFIHHLNKFISSEIYVGIVDHLINELISNCYKKELYYKRTGCIGLYWSLSNLSLPIAERYHINSFNALSFIISNTDPFVSQDIIDIASEGLMYICMDVSDRHTEELIKNIIHIINSYCSPTLNMMFTCLSLISQLKGFPYHEIFEEFKAQFVDPLNNIHFDKIPEEKKLGYIEILCNCVKSNIKVLTDFDFNKILMHILNELSRLKENNIQTNDSLLFRISSLDLFYHLSKELDYINLNTNIITRIVSFYMDSVMNFDNRNINMALKGLEIMSESPISAEIVRSHLQQLITLLINCSDEKLESEYLNSILLILIHVRNATIDSPHLFISYLSNRLGSDGAFRTIKCQILSLFDNKIPALILEILQLYNLKSQDIQHIISIAIRLAAFFNKNMNECSHKIVNIFYNYYRPCLFELLDRYPNEVLEYFYYNLSDISKFYLFKNIIISNHALNIKREMLNNPQSFIRATFNCPKTTQEEARGIRLNGILITLILIKGIPEFLEKNKEVVQCLLYMWNRIRDTPNHLDFFLNSSLVSETKLIAKCLVQYCKRCKSDSKTLFSLVSMFSTNNSSELDEIDDYCKYYIQTNYTDEEKRNLLLSSINLYIDPGNTNNFKLQILKKVINPLVKYCFDVNNYHVLNSTIISKLVENLIIKDHSKEHVIPIEADVESFITIEVLTLASLILKNLPKDLLNFEKPLLSFGWKHFRTKDRRLKQYANIFMGYYISLFGGHIKLFLKVYENLLNSFNDYIQSDVINCMEHLLPKLYTLAKDQGWIKLTVKMLLNKMHSMAQSHHIVKILKQNAVYFYPFRNELVDSLITLRKPYLIGSLDGIKLVMNKLKILLQWIVWENEEFGDKEFNIIKNNKVFEYEYYNFVNKKLLFKTNFENRLIINQKDEIIHYLSSLYLSYDDKDILKQNYFSSIRSTVLVMLRYYLLFFKDSNLPFDIMKDYLNENQNNPNAQINIITMLHLYIDTKRYEIFHQYIDKLEPLLGLLISTNFKEVTVQFNQFLKSYKEVIDTQDSDIFYKSISNIFRNISLNTKNNQFDIKVLFILNNSFMFNKETLWIPLLLLDQFINNAISDGNIQNDVKNYEKSIESLVYTLGLSVYIMNSNEIESFLNSLFKLIQHHLNWNISYVILNTLNDIFINYKNYLKDYHVMPILNIIEAIIINKDDNNKHIYEIIIQICQMLENHHNIDYIYMKIALTTASHDIRNKSLDMIKRKLSNNFDSTLEMILDHSIWKPVNDYYWIPICIDLILDYINGEDLTDINLPLPSSLTYHPLESRDDIESYYKELNNRLTIKSVINFIRQFIYIDSNFTSYLWIELFPSLWRILQQENLYLKFISFLEHLINEEMKYQKYFYPNVIQTLLKGIALNQESNIIISPSLLKKSALEYDTWFDSIYILERNVSLQVYYHNNEFSKYLGEIYESLGEYDNYYWIVQNLSESINHKDAIMFSKYSMFDKASKEYVKCMESTYDSDKEKYQFYKKEYLKCSRELSLWDNNFPVYEESSTIDLSLGRQDDWNRFKQTFSSLNNKESLSILYQYYLFIKENNTESLNNLDHIYLNNLMKEWIKYPKSILNHSSDLIISLQRVLEVHEYEDILRYIKENDITSIKNILKIWHHRLPDENQSFSQWYNILEWRKYLLHKIEEIKPDINIKDEIIRIQLKLSNIARKKNLISLSHKILDEINISLLTYHDNIYNYSREMLKNQISNKSFNNLEIINTLNLSNLTNEQLSDIYSLRAKLYIHHLDNKQENNFYFESAQFNDKNSKNWLEWAKFHDHCFEEESSKIEYRKQIIHMSHAIYCYFQCIKYNLQYRIYIPKILYYIIQNHNGVYNETIINSTHFLLSPTHRTNLFPQYSDNLPDLSFNQLIQLLFNKYNSHLPSWIWIKWIPYLISSLNRPEVELVKKLLMNINESNPNSTFFPIKVLIEQTQNQSYNDLSKVATDLMNHLKSLHPLLYDRLMMISKSISEISELDIHEKFLHQLQLLYIQTQNQYISNESAHTQLKNAIDSVRYKSKSLKDIFEKNSAIITDGNVTLILETLINAIKLQYPSKCKLIKHHLFSQSFITDKIELFGVTYENQIQLVNRTYISVFKPRIKILNSFGSPRRIISILCNDGSIYYYYIDTLSNYDYNKEIKKEKRLEWEKEIRMNHILKLMNLFLKQFNESRKRNISICVSNFLQTSLETRVLSVEDSNTLSLYQIYEDWCYRNNLSVYSYIKQSNQPSDIILLKYFEVLLKDSCEALWRFRNSLSLSFGVYSLIQYLFSVLHNDPYHINVLCNTGQVFQHSIYPNINEIGKITSPHKVPFRLTPNIQKLIYKGVFETSLISSALALNRKKYNEIIQQYLQIYYYYDNSIHHNHLNKKDIINSNIQDFKNKLIQLLSEGKDREEYFYRSLVIIINKAIDMNNLATMRCTWYPWL